MRVVSSTLALYWLLIRTLEFIVDIYWLLIVALGMMLSQC